MYSVGVIRKLDDLGRVVLPIEMRKAVGLEADSPVDIKFIDGQFILTPYKPFCQVCGEINGVINYKNTVLCGNCLSKMNKKKEFMEEMEKEIN